MKRTLQRRYIKISTVGEAFKVLIPEPCRRGRPSTGPPALRARFDAALPPWGGLLASGRLDAVTDLLSDAALLLYSFVRPS